MATTSAKVGAHQEDANQTRTPALARGPLTRSAKRRLDAAAAAVSPVEPRHREEMEAPARTTVPAPTAKTHHQSPRRKKARTTHGVTRSKGITAPAAPPVHGQARDETWLVPTVSPGVVSARRPEESDDDDGSELPAHEQGLQLTDDMIKAAQTGAEAAGGGQVARAGGEEAVRVGSDRDKTRSTGANPAGTLAADFQGDAWLGVGGPSVRPSYLWAGGAAVLVAEPAARSGQVCARVLQCGSRKARPREVIPPLRSL
ncbi:hypothetical protein PF008_g18359 [Phytophthora fragariae]|uniref:Uncharacterized protein n=1 Tax=Phytophthora fragariae TaxID=53985 RepID=A0A6G0R6V8_9STRA|nr:hypothetical protein PF008_g18359 [Phytophthora fragariae]